MIEKNLGTMVTYTISDDDARATLVEILEDLDYEDGNDQSTMICKNRIPTRTIDEVNDFCQSNPNDFVSGDILSIYFAQEVRTVRGDVLQRICRREYRFSMKMNKFI